LERSLLAIRSLAELEPRSAVLQTSHASNLVYAASSLPADLQAERLREADDVIAKALRLKPGYPFAIATQEYAHTLRGASPLESERLLATSRPGGSAWGDGFPLYRRGMNLLGNGRTAEAILQLRASEAARPSFSQVAAFHAYGLASQGKAADAELLFERIFATEPGSTLVWAVWARAAVLENVGDAASILAAAPENVPRATVACWRSVLAARRAGDPGPPADSLRDCGPVVYILAALDRVDEAFDFHLSSPGRRLDTALLFAPSMRAMRGHKRFLLLMKDLGLWEYWVETRTHPDVCDLPAERDIEVCVELRKAQGK
jgi:hypothetical protein